MNFRGYLARISTVLLLLAPVSWAQATVAVRSASWATEVDHQFNLYRMGDGLYRSALPQAENQAELEQLEIKTVINLYQRSDSEWLTNPNIRQVQLPIRSDRISDAQVLEILRSIRLALAEGPVLIHCKHGQNRTGLIAAVYRMVYEGWSKQQALDEMLQGGFGGQERMTDALDYLNSLDLDALRLALENGSCSTSAWAMCNVGQWFASLKAQL